MSNSCTFHFHSSGHFKDQPSSFGYDRHPLSEMKNLNGCQTKAHWCTMYHILQFLAVLAPGILVHGAFLYIFIQHDLYYS